MGNKEGRYVHQTVCEAIMKNIQVLKVSMPLCEGNTYRGSLVSASVTISLIGQSIYAKLWLNPPQIATEAFSSDLLPERCPE